MTPQKIVGSLCILAGLGTFYVAFNVGTFDTLSIVDVIVGIGVLIVGVHGITHEEA